MPRDPQIKSGDRPKSRSTGGFALIAALALLVMLGSTGAIMLRLSSQQQASGTATIMGARAQWAAQSGIEWALHRAVALDSCPAATSVLNLTEGVLSGFTVTVRCTSSQHVEGSEERTSLSIRAEASWGTFGERDYTYREVRAAAVL